MIIEKYETKSLIREGAPSLFSWAEINLNPYQGCYHDCKYCDGKSTRYYMHEDFADRIRVKKNALILFEQFLRKKGYFPTNRDKTSTLIDFFPSLKVSAESDQPGKFIIYIGGGVCDTYQPAEKEVKITRKLLQIAYDYNFPVFILTKNKLVTRDINLLKKINEKSNANVSLTITLADEKIQKIFEPRASTTQERFDTVKKLRAEGIHSGVYLYPALPFIGDSEENIHSIYKQAKQAKAEFIYCWGLTLKPGRNKDEFFQTLKSYYPTLLPKYHKLYGNNNKYGIIDINQFKEMNLVWPAITAYKYAYEYDIPYTAKRYIPEGRIKTNLLVSETLRKIAYVKSDILGVTAKETHRFNRTASFVESHPTDISEHNIANLKSLKIPKSVLPIIDEFLAQKRSIYLEELEKKVYNSLKG